MEGPSHSATGAASALRRLIAGLAAGEEGAGSASGRQASLLWLLDADPGALGCLDLSLSLRSTGSPRWRGMVQVPSAAPGEVTTERIRIATAALLRRAAATAGQDYGSELFEALFATVYLGGSDAPARPLRFGIGLEPRGAGSAALRLYLDLFAQGPQHGPSLGERVLEILTGRPRPRVPTGWPEGAAAFGRVVGVDLAPGGPRQLKIYLAGSRFGTDRRHGRPVGWATGGAFDSLAAVARCLGRTPAQVLAAPSTLVGAALPLAGSEGPPTLKLDVHLPDHLPDDEACRRSVLALCADLGVPAAAYRRGLPLVLEGRAAAESVNLHQYLSVDALPSGRYKVNVYFRPRSAGADRLPARSRPRSACEHHR